MVQFRAGGTRREPFVLLTPARTTTFNRLASEGYLSVEGTLLRLAPRMSHLPPEIVAEAPGFWGPPSEREP